MAITASPIIKSVSTSAPISSSTPAASMPGTYGAVNSFCPSARAPLRTAVSVGFTVAAADADAHLARAGVGLGHLEDLQGFGPAVLDHTDHLHVATLRFCGGRSVVDSGFPAFRAGLVLTDDEPRHAVGATDQPLLEETIGEVFDRIVAAHPDHEALVVPFQDVRLTYRQLDDAVDRLARGLLGVGLAKGDRVGIWSPNNAEWVLRAVRHRQGSA